MVSVISRVAVPVMLWVKLKAVGEALMVMEALPMLTPMTSERASGEVKAVNVPVAYVV